MDDEDVEGPTARVDGRGAEAGGRRSEVGGPEPGAGSVELGVRPHRRTVHWRTDVPLLPLLAPNSPLSALKTDEWHQMIDVNIKGVLNGVAAVLPTFIEQKSGQVIATSSVAGLKAYPGTAVYSGTKWFLRDFMEVLRMESAMEGTNIRTATIYPAAINTELLNTISHKDTAEGAHNLYDKYGISPDRIASVVAFAIDQPEDTTVNEFTVGPANQPW